MKVLFFGNNWLGLQCLQFLKEQNVDVVGIVLHPPGEEKYGREIRNIYNLPDSATFSGDQVNLPEVRQAMSKLLPDIGVSILFGYILKNEVLDLFPRGTINLHPAFLPFNRGQYPNIWSIVEGTPAGVTLHYIDKGIDTGEIISQVQIPVYPTDTGESLYRRLEKFSVELFCKSWPSIAKGDTPRVQQKSSEGSFHKTADAESISRIELNRKYEARDLINLIRAFTFPPYDGAYFEENGKRVYLRLQLYTKDDK